MGRKVLVLGEARDGGLRNVSFEAISAASTVADGGEIVAALVGKNVKALSEELLRTERIKLL